MTTTIPKEISEWVSSKEKELPATIRRHINTATYDLYFGPYQAGDRPDDDEYIYPGFTEAVAQIQSALSDISDIWYQDWSGCILTSEPDYGYMEEDPETGEEVWMDDSEGWYHYDRADLLRLICGRELASYI